MHPVIVKVLSFVSSTLYEKMVLAVVQGAWPVLLYRKSPVVEIDRLEGKRIALRRVSGMSPKRVCRRRELADLNCQS